MKLQCWFSRVAYFTFADGISHSWLSPKETCNFKALRHRGWVEQLLFASLKKEGVHHAAFRTREEAKAAVFGYIEIFYNRQRLHSAVGYRTPAEARKAMLEVRVPAAA